MAEIFHGEVIWRALAHAAQTTPERRGFIFQDRNITFREMDEITDRLAFNLLRLGYKKGDRLGIIALNQPEWLYTYFAAAKIGVVIVGLSVRYREQEFEYILNQSESRGLVTLAALGDQVDYVKFFDAFKDRIPSVKEFFFIGGAKSPWGYAFADLQSGEIDRAELEKAKGAVQPDDLMMLIYTSGTTGRPKGAAITHRGQLASAKAQARHTKITPDDLVQLALPLNHVGGITCGALTMLVGRATTELIPMFDPNLIIRQAGVNPPTLITGVPTMHTLLLMSENISKLNTATVRLVVTGGSNADPALLKKLMDAYPQAKVMNLYGLSESSGAVVLSPWESDFDATVKSIGKPIGDFQAKVVDPEGREVQSGQVGELLFKAEAAAAGYFKMPEETALAFDQDGWLHTGDMGFLDENGYIVLMGRLKEMFIQGGFNVYPVEVENLLAKHPKVALAAGIGVPDPVLGEIGRYYIVPKPGQEVTEDEIKNFCRDKLADYKVPRQVVIRAELPLTPVGKIMKSKLKEEALGR
ncbi:MAG: AMP-binding protein [Pseudomonadota bacterium]